MSSDITMLRAKLRKALDNVGRNNGHACPPTSSNIDPLLHELFVASEAMSYWKGRHEKARKEALASADDGSIDDTVSRVAETDVTETMVVAKGELYTLTLQVVRSAARFDQKALRNALIVDHGMSREAVDKLFDDATKKSAPAKRFSVAT